LFPCFCRKTPPPQWAMASSFLRFLDHTHWRTTFGMTPLEEWSVRRGDHYLTTHNTHNRQTSIPAGGIRTHNLSRRAAVDLRLRPRGHWDRLPYYVCFTKVVNGCDEWKNLLYPLINHMIIRALPRLNPTSRHCFKDVVCFFKVRTYLEAFQNKICGIAESKTLTVKIYDVESSWNVMAHGAARVGGKVTGKLANGVGSQFSSHYLGTCCIQHYYHWCAHLGCQ